MTSSFFDSQPAKSPDALSTADRFQVERDQYGRRMLPNAEGKMVPWTGVTTIARVLEDEYNIYQWKLRQAAWGQAHSPHLIALAGAAAKDDRKTLNEVVEKSLEVASDHKADLGNALHNILARVDAGMDVSEVPEYFRPFILSYSAELNRHGWDIIPEFIERSIVCNRYNIDGIGDRWVQRKSDGLITYMDIKTGDDPGKYPHKPTIQLALCANADAAIDHATGAQVPMPPVCKDFALVMHIDPTIGEAKLLRCDDIMLGWAAVRLAYETRKWRQTEVVFHPYISEANWQPKPTKPAAMQAVGPNHDGLFPCELCNTPKCPTCDNCLSGNCFAGARGLCQCQIVSQPGQPEVWARPALTEHPVPYATETEHDRSYFGGNGHAAPLSDPWAVINVNAGVEPIIQQVGAAIETLAAGFTPPIDPETEVEELLQAYKTKPPLVDLCKDLGITDVKHHRRDLATLIVKKRNELRAAGVKIESPKPNGGESTATPQPTIDPNTEAVISDIRNAASMDALRAIHGRWTALYGPDSWSGDVLAAGHRRMTELRTVNH